MNATLLCPGPSLAAYTGSGRGLVIGVNRAVTLHACDVWAATDMPLVKKTKPLGEPVLLTIAATRDSLQRRGLAWDYPVVTHDDVAGETVTNGKHPWTRYTATAALQYLAWSGVTRIEAWGVDWAGSDDWDGEHDGGCRTTQRWKNEQTIWNQVIESTGVKVYRHGLNG